MNKVDILDVKSSILEDNDADAQDLRRELKEKGLFYLNVMSSPGSGKTTVIMETLERLKDRCRLGVMEADIDSDVDALKIKEAGFQAVQLHTGGMCHLDADMSRQGLALFKEEELNGVILENVGNLVCPAEFDTGAVKNVVILSVPEGDDKPAKYPLIFKTCQVVLVNKIDTAPIFDFDFERLERDIHSLNPKALILPVSARTGEGMDPWCAWLADEIEAWIGR